MLLSLAMLENVFGNLGSKMTRGTLEDIPIFLYTTLYHIYLLKCVLVRLCRYFDMHRNPFGEHLVECRYFLEFYMSKENLLVFWKSARYRHCQGAKIAFLVHSLKQKRIFTRVISTVTEILFCNTPEN